MSNPYGQNPDANEGEPGSGGQPSYGQTPPPASGPTYGQTPPPAYGQTPPPPSDPGYGQPPSYGQPSYGQSPYGQPDQGSYPGYGQTSAYGQPEQSGYPAYGQNPYGAYGAVGQPHPQGTAILVLGIVGIVVCGIAAVVALVMGNKALKEIDANPTAYNNRQMVVVGRILGIVGTVLWGLVIVGYVIFFIALAGSAALN